MRKTLLLLKASAAVALIATNASAFDELNWEWNKVVDEEVTKVINIEANITPTGMTEVEKLQIHVGDLQATSTVTNITNNPPAGEGNGGVIDINETFEFLTSVDDSQDPSVIVAPVNGDPGGGPGLVTAVLTGGTEDEGSDELHFFIDVDGQIPFQVVPADALDAATELPTVASAATAVANNQDIESAVSTQLHEAQIVFDVCGECGPNNGFDPVGPNPTAGLGNTFHQAGFSTALAAAVGVIDKSAIGAVSTVSDITNARVESNATALGNNLSVDLSAALPGDQLLIGDITQVAVADVTAMSSVTGVTLTNYAGLGGEGVNPIVSSTASAIGNNVNINVGVPDVGN